MFVLKKFLSKILYLLLLFIIRNAFENKIYQKYAKNLLQIE